MREIGNVIVIEIENGKGIENEDQRHQFRLHLLVLPRPLLRRHHDGQERTGHVQRATAGEPLRTPPRRLETTEETNHLQEESLAVMAAPRIIEIVKGNRREREARESTDESLAVTAPATLARPKVEAVARLIEGHPEELELDQVAVGEAEAKEIRGGGSADQASSIEEQRQQYEEDYACIYSSSIAASDQHKQLSVLED